METQIIFEAIREIKDLIALNTNHIGIINGEMGNIQMDVAVLKAQISEIMWTTRAIIGAFVILFVGQVWRMMVAFKNGKNGKK